MDNPANREDFQWRMRENLDWFRNHRRTLLQKCDIHTDTILQRLPEGMGPRDSLDSHMERCVHSLKEIHVFETSELAKKFISARCPQLVLGGETDDFAFYACPLGEHEETCTAYAKVLKKESDSHIVEVCFLHYGHDKAIGQFRFTQIHFLLIRLFIDFYWKTVADSEWNVHNMVYCFKHWFSDVHTLHFISIFDIKAIAKELGKPELRFVDTKNGVFHAERMTAEKRFFNETFKPIWTLEPKNSRQLNPIHLEEGSPTVPYMNTCAEVFSANPGQDPWRFQEDTDAFVAIQSWEGIEICTQQMRATLNLTIFSSNLPESVFNHVQEVVEMLNHFCDVAQNMSYRLKSAVGFDAIQPTYIFRGEDLELAEPLFPNFFPSSYPNFYFPLKQNYSEDNLKVVFSSPLYPLIVPDDTMCVALRDDAIIHLPGPSSGAITAERKMVDRIEALEEEEYQEFLNRQTDLEFPAPVFIGTDFSNHIQAAQTTVVPAEQPAVQPQLTKNQKKKNKKKLKKMQEKEEQERQRLRDQPLRHYDP